MQKELIYPFDNMTLEELLKTGKAIKYSIDEEDQIKFTLKKEEVKRNHVMLVSILAYIKLLTNLVSKKKKEKLEYTNKYIKIIRDECIDSITNLEKIDIDKIINSLNIKDTKDNRKLLSLIVNGYELEHDVVLLKRKGKYKPAINKTTNSMNLEKNKVLMLTPEKRK